MAISLSEQLESDIKEYLHKTFGTYFSSLDERFAADIKEDVITHRISIMDFTTMMTSPSHSSE